MKPLDERIVLGLYIAGFVVVLLSEVLGLLAVGRPYGPNGWHWSPEGAHRAAEIIRWLGAMLFAAGLIERVVHALSAGREPGEPPTFKENHGPAQENS